MKSYALTFVLCALATSSCVVATGPAVVAGPAEGAIAFDWSFDGDSSCFDAGVDNLDIVVSDDVTGDVVVDDTAEPCSGTGLTITGVPEGTMNVDITAFDPFGNAIFAGGFSVDVFADATADVGVITLDPIPPPGPGPG